MVNQLMLVNLAKTRKWSKLFIILCMFSISLSCTEGPELRDDTAGAGQSSVDSGDKGGQNAGDHAGDHAGDLAGTAAPNDTPSTLSIYEGLKPSCEMCHAQGQSLPIFESLNQFERLVVTDPQWIMPGVPSESNFVSVLRGDWRGVYTQMPPSGGAYALAIAGQGDAPSMETIESWILGLGDVEISEPEETPCVTTPSRGQLARLSRLEYRNATRDLLGTSLDPGADFPEENESYGFSHISALLTLSPLLIEKYDLAAASLAAEAIPSHSPPTSVYILEAELDMTSMVGRAYEEVWNLWSNGDLQGFVMLPSAGEYQISAQVSGGQAGSDPVRLALLVDGVEQETFQITAQTPDRDTVQISVNLSAGEHAIGVRFLNDYYCSQMRFEAGECDERGDRNLLIDRVRIEGPTAISVPPSAFETRFVTCDPVGEQIEVCTRSILTRFGRLAWRRPLEIGEVDRLWTLIQSEPKWRDGMRLALRALLLSPHFIFRLERAPEGQPLSAYERAARLAAFIWRSVPDETLLDAAASGDLDNREGIISEVSRLLADPRAQELVRDFGGRWMQLHHLEAAAPDYDRFPQFNEELRASMHEESTRVLQTIVDEERPLLDLVNADFTWLNPQLAVFYGLEGELDPNDTDLFQRVALPQGGRQGFLTQGAWLTLTSHPTRTSPVVRGKWVLENLLCAPPPPPPPSVEGLPETGVDQDASLRERFEQHRADPACAACHTHMDAIGFGFERFDGIGQFRLMDGREVIDPSGELPTEPPTVFNDAVEMINALRVDPALPRCVTERMVIFALGRGVSEEERCMVDEIMRDAGTLSLQELARAIAGSVMMTTQGESR